MARNIRHDGSEEELMRMSLEEMQAIANSTNFQHTRTYKEQAEIMRKNLENYEKARTARLAKEKAEELYIHMTTLVIK